MKRVLKLLDQLDDRNIHYQLDHLRPGAVTVFFTLVGARVEVDFSVTDMTYRVYRGREDVETDLDSLMRIIDAKG